MQPSHKQYEHRSPDKIQADFPSMKDLLLKQTKGKIPLSREEKLRVQRYAESTRKERN